MRLLPVRVGCREEARGREKPAWVELEGARLEVVEITDRWYEGPRQAGGPMINYYKAVLEDGREVLLRYVGLFDGWAVVERE